MDYIDIGHGMASFHSELWLYRHGKLEIHSAASGTHNSVWGLPAMDFFRGRFDNETGHLSISPPRFEPAVTVPTELVSALKAQFNFVAAYYFRGGKLNQVLPLTC